MAIRERYRDKVGYLFKKKPNIKGQPTNKEWETEGIPFNCSIVTVKKKVYNPIAGVYKTSSDQVIKTDTQMLLKYGVDFDEFDRIAFTPTPRNDVNQQDYGLIDNADKEPINAKGSRYRKQDYWSYTITLK